MDVGTTLVEAFNKLKAVTKEQVLLLSDFEKPFEVNMDALDKANGGVIA